MSAARVKAATWLSHENGYVRAELGRGMEARVVPGMPGGPFVQLLALRAGWLVVVATYGEKQIGASLRDWPLTYRRGRNRPVELLRGPALERVWVAWDAYLEGFHG